MRKTIAASILLTIINTTAAKAQTDPNTIIDEIITEAAESDNEDLLEEAMSTAEYLQGIMQDKVNINTATRSDLQKLPFISNQQIIKIEEYKKENGIISSIGEIKILDSQNRRNLRLYSTFLDAKAPNDSLPARPGQLIHDGQHSITLSGKTQTGAQSPAYAIRYRYNSHNRLEWGFTAENDLGEQMRLANQKYGFDFNSAFLKVAGLGIVDNLIIGDYTVRFGEGLILGQGMGMGKSMQAAAMSASERTIHQHTSCNESSYYRGAAATIGAGRISITTFASRNLTDATCQDSATFQNLKNTGYHRTQKEINSKHNLLESHLGMLAHISGRIATIGAAVHYFGFSKTYSPAPELRNAPLRSIRQGTEYSISYKVFGNMISLCGESAMDAGKSISTINRIDITPHQTFRLRLIQRYYSPGYHAFRASAFGAGSRVGNECGYYIGAIISPSDRFTLEAWADSYTFPWITSKAKEPSGGHEIMSQARLQISRTATIQIKAKAKERQVVPDGNACQRSGYINAAMIYSPIPYLQMSTSAQWSRYSDSTSHSKGYLIMQNAQWQTSGGILQLSARYAIFSAPYNARAYSHESDVSHIYSVPAYYNTGTRYYLMASVRVAGLIRIQARYSQWNYARKEGVSEPRKNEISLALIYKTR